MIASFFLKDVSISKPKNQELFGTKLSKSGGLKPFF